jgi:hypothetical protein
MEDADHQPRCSVEGRIMACLRSDLVVGPAFWGIVLSLVCHSSLGREVKLVICPQKVSAEAGKYTLLPPAASLTDGDAVALYGRAAQALMADADWARVDKWLALPPEKLPLDEVEGVLERHVTSLKDMAQAVRCRQCDWPHATDGASLGARLGEFRRLGSLVRLWTLYEIAQGSPESAILALRTGFGMARQIGQAPSTLQYSAGMAVAALMRDGVAQFVQMEEAPNLYAALTALPKPLADIEKTIESERKGITPEMLAAQKMTREQFERMLAPVYDGMRVGARRWESDLALLECVEALRSYAASHGGQLPQNLGEITEVSVRKDPMTAQAFRYSRTGATAVLESPAPPGNKKEVIIRYQITVRK